MPDIVLKSRHMISDSNCYRIVRSTSEEPGTGMRGRGLLCSSPGSSIENEGLWARTEFLDDGRDKDRSLPCLTGDKFLSPLPLLTELV